MRKLKIAQIAPLAYSIPPKKYGGTERAVHVLTEELVSRGHDVTLFATADSKTRAKLVSIFHSGLNYLKAENSRDWTLMNLLNIGNAYSMQKKFDIIHDHMSALSLPIANFSKVPVVMTLHGNLDEVTVRLFERFTKPYLISISNSQIKNYSNISTITNIYHGLNFNYYPFSKTPKKYLLFVGRFFPGKGAHFAIEVAEKLGLPLIMAAKLPDNEKEYFNKFIYPNLNENIRWIGEVGENERNRLMSEALCLLHPAIWNEPFGLNMIEAMGCGCPVVAFGNGSIPEIVKDGVSGFVVNSISEMVSAVKNISKIDRYECKKYVMNTFNSQKMAENYEDVYNEILSFNSFESKKYLPQKQLVLKI